MALACARDVKHLLQHTLVLFWDPGGTRNYLLYRPWPLLVTAFSLQCLRGEVHRFFAQDLYARE